MRTGGSITFTHESTKIKSIEIHGAPLMYGNISPWYHPVDGDITNSGITKWSAGTDGPQSSVIMLEQSEGDFTHIINISKVVFTVVPIHVTGVSLDKTTTQTVNKDNTTPYVTLTASISPDSATDKKVKWSVDNTNVKLYSDSICQTEVGTDAVDTLTVYAKGMSAGNATVTVTTNDSLKTASCNMVVEDVNTVINLINALPANVTVNDVDAIDAARNAYENLANEVKESFSSDVLAKLTDAEAKLAELDKFSVDSGDGSRWTKGSGSTLPFVFKRSIRDDTIREFFKGVKVDGNSVDLEQDGTKNYDIGFGSVVITFQPAYLERLSLGDHIVTASFGEKTVDAKFTINPAPESSEDTTPKYRLPKTGIE